MAVVFILSMAAIFVVLTGVAALLGVRYRELADGEFNHSSALVLLDAQGRVVARTERLGPVPDPAFLAAVKSTLAASAAPAAK